MGGADDMLDNVHVPPSEQASFALDNRIMPSAAFPQHEMPSWTTLTPFYEEDVLYALDAPALARSMMGGRSGAGSTPTQGSPAAIPNSVRNMSDLLTETEDNVSLMAYLR